MLRREGRQRQLIEPAESQGTLPGRVEAVVHVRRERAQLSDPSISLETRISLSAYIVTAEVRNLHHGAHPRECLAPRQLHPQVTGGPQPRGDPQTLQVDDLVRLQSSFAAVH